MLELIALSDGFIAVLINSYGINGKRIKFFFLGAWKNWIYLLYVASALLFIHRLIYRRKLLRFTQEELAREIGISRASLSNFEAGVQEMPFAVGLALCRRLNTSPRWVVDGEMPEVPFVELEKLSLNQSEIMFKASRMAFPQGYLYLKDELNAWFAKYSFEDSILQYIEQSSTEEALQESVRTASIAVLHEWIDSFSEEAKKGGLVGHSFKAVADVAQRELKARLAVQELDFRMKVKVPRRKKGRKESLLVTKALTDKRLLPYNSENMKGSLVSHWIARANDLLLARGAKAALARHLGVKPQSVHAFLTGASAPSAENILRLQAWVIEEEAKKEIPGSGGTLPGTKTRTRKSDHENTQSSHKSG